MARNVAIGRHAGLATALWGAVALAGVPTHAGAQNVEYYHTDAIGNVRAVTNQAQQVVERHDYLPYGEEWCPGPPAGVCGSVTPGQAKRFTGKERDPETGLDYFGARYYGSKIGRFTTTDPVYTWPENLVDPQRWNRYAYARNNPLRYIDPDGRVIDTVADIGFVAYDLFDMGRSAFSGQGVSGTQWLALGADVGGAMIPFASGGGLAVRAASKADNAIALLKAGDKAADAGRAADVGQGARFIVEPNGTVADTLATPPGRYRQPDTGHMTDVLQKADHGHGHSHTHEMAVHRNPKDPSKGSTRKTGVTRPVSADEARNIQTGAAEKLPPRGRQ